MKHTSAPDPEPTDRDLDPVAGDPLAAEASPGVDPATDGGYAGGPVQTRGGALGTIWVTLALGALVTILLLVFILQNLDKVTTHFLGTQFEMPLGVLMLFAAIVGALIMAASAGGRILQLRMRAHRARAGRQTTR